MQTRRRNLLQPRAWASALGATIGWMAPHEKNGDEQLIRAGRRAMACRFEVFFAASDSPKIAEIHEALDTIQRIEWQMSVFREDSEVSALNRQAHDHPVEVEENLFGLLQLGVELHTKTRGAFDLTASSLWRCWGFAVGKGHVPEQIDLEAARRCLGSDQLDLDAFHRSVFFRRKGLELNLGSIGKGYALDHAATVLRNAELDNALLHGGYSSVLAMGNAPSGCVGTGWLVGVRHPLERKKNVARIRLKEQGLATSGAGEQYFLAEGKKYGHVIDPRTGYPADLYHSVIVLAKTAAEADALSTAFFVMPLDEIEDFCKKDQRVRALVISKTESNTVKCISFGLTPEDLEVFP